MQSQINKNLDTYHLTIFLVDNIVNIYDDLVKQNVLKNDNHQRSVIKNLQELSEDIRDYKPHNLGFLDKVTGKYVNHSFLTFFLLP